MHAIIYIQLYTYTINCDHTCLICNSLKPTSASYYKLKSFIFLWSRPIFHSQLLFSSVSIRRLTQRCWSCHNASSRMVQKTRPHVYGTQNRWFWSFWYTLLTLSHLDRWPNRLYFSSRTLHLCTWQSEKRPPRCKAIQLPASDFKSRPTL